MHNVKVGVGQEAGAQGPLTQSTPQISQKQRPIWLFSWEPLQGVGTLSSFVRQGSGLSVCVWEGEQCLLGVRMLDTL